jgi:hypothetical protein
VRWRIETAKLDRPLRPGMDLGDRKVVLEDPEPIKTSYGYTKSCIKQRAHSLYRPGPAV